MHDRLTIPEGDYVQGHMTSWVCGK